MAPQGDEVAERIEAKIREAVNRMMSEVRTSIADVREAIEQQLDAALQSVQADVNAFAFRAHLDEGLRELTESYEARLSEAPTSEVTSDQVKQGIRAIESGRNQVEILSTLLDEVLKYGSRSALLILKADTLAGWKGVGFSAHGGNDELVKRFSASTASIPQFEQLLREEHSVVWDGSNLADRFGVGAPERAVLIPMVIKDKVAAAVYLDAVTSDVSRFDQSAVELLVFITGLLIDTLAIRKKVPSPTLSAPARTIPPARPTPEPELPQPGSETVAVRGSSTLEKADSTEPGTVRPTEAGAPPPPPSTPPPAAPPEAPMTFGSISSGSAATETAAPPPSRSFELQTEPPAERSWPRPPEPEEGEVESNFATAMFPMMKPAAPAGEKPAAIGPTPVADLADRPTTQYIPPPGLARGGIFAGKPDEDRRHEEARRFARLLVSEIKLYNESQVEQGRRDRDLYERLKEDIDRSRQMYDERVPDDVRKGTNYFFEELVRILADGNREALGL